MELEKKKYWEERARLAQKASNETNDASYVYAFWKEYYLADLGNR